MQNYSSTHKITHSNQELPEKQFKQKNKMKLSITLFLTSIVSSSAFVAVGKSGCSAPLQMSDPNSPDGEWREPEPVKKVAIKSQALPFTNAPLTLDGSMAGDVGFDPLGFAKTEVDLSTYREAEIKHARLAMLAAAGWPLSELWDKKIASLFGLPGMLDDAGRVPSVLNGGLEKVSPFYWGFCIILAAAVDFYGVNRASIVKDYIPGDLGFDPFGLYPKDDKGKKWMQAAEIKNGRIAMIAITAFAFQEFASHVAIIDEVPFLFKPFWATLADNAPSTYVIPPTVYEAPPIFELSAPMSSSFTEPVVDAITSAVTPSIDAAASSPAAEAVTTMSSTMDAVSSATTTTGEAATSVIIPPPAAEGSDELIEAKKRIVELEAKLAAVGVSP
mmetsp:Transcript_5765/g.6648  ORF Transcript_5765/g.6648 Transcript_5765/m.6648 type:complete len:388 (-) Transcript_5765:58-1221(-)